MNKSKCCPQNSNAIGLEQTFQHEETFLHEEKAERTGWRRK